MSCWSPGVDSNPLVKFIVLFKSTPAFSSMYNLTEGIQKSHAFINAARSILLASAFILAIFTFSYWLLLLYFNNSVLDLQDEISTWTYLAGSQILIGSPLPISSSEVNTNSVMITSRASSFLPCLLTYDGIGFSHIPDRMSGVVLLPSIYHRELQALISSVELASISILIVTRKPNLLIPESPFIIIINLAQDSIISPASPVSRSYPAWPTASFSPPVMELCRAW